MSNFGKWFGVAAVTVAAVTMISCVPKTQSDGKKKMEDCGYTVETMTADDIDVLLGGGLEIGAKTAISCVKEKEEEMLLAFWFNSKEDAEDFEAVFKMVENTLSAEFGDVETKYEVEGEVFYYGTLQACKDFTD